MGELDKIEWTSTEQIVNLHSRILEKLLDDLNYMTKFKLRKGNWEIVEFKKMNKKQRRK